MGTVEVFYRKLLSSESVLLIGHPFPDGDAVGSGIALKLLLDNEGIRSTLVLPHYPPVGGKQLLEDLNVEYYIAPVEEIETQWETVVAIEMGSLKRFEGSLRRIGKEISYEQVLNIDHHQSNEGFGTFNLIDPSAPALAYMLIKGLPRAYMNDEKILSSLVYGILSDTGGLSHSNVSSELLELLAEVRPKIDWRYIARLAMNRTVRRQKLICRLMENLRELRINGKLVRIGVLSAEDLAELGADTQVAEKLADELSFLLPVADVIILIRYEPSIGKNKLSLRGSREEYRVDLIAEKFGGGGHKLAAGAVTELSVEDIIQEILKMLRENLRA